MDCRDYSEQLATLAIVGESEEPSGQLRAHLAACQSCAERRASLERFAAELGVSRPAADRWQRLSDRLDEAAAMVVEEEASPGSESCALCRAALGAQRRDRCPECREGFHATCWKKNGGCVSEGCPLNPKLHPSPSFRAPGAARRTRVRWAALVLCLVGAGAGGPRLLAWWQGEAPTEVADARPRRPAAAPAVRKTATLGERELPGSASKPAPDSPKPPPGAPVGDGPEPEEEPRPLPAKAGAERPSPLPPLWAGSHPELIRRRLRSCEVMIDHMSAFRPEPPRLPQLRSRAQAIRRVLKGAVAPGEEDRPELYMVACGFSREKSLGGGLGATVRVKVTRKGAPLELYLSAHDAVHWVIEAAEGVTIRRVYVAGDESPQTFEGPEGLRGFGGISRARFEAGERRADHLRLPVYAEALGRFFGTLIEERIGLELRAARCESELSQVTIGPESETWRLQLVHREVDALFAELIGDRLPREEAALASLARRWASAFPVDSLGDSSRESALSRLFPPRTAAQAKARGLRLPEVGTEQTSFSLGQELLVEPKTRRVYMITDHRLYVCAPTGEASYGEPRELLDLSWASGLAFDSKRRRFFISAGLSDERLFTYEPAANKVREIAGRSPKISSPDRPAIQALAYDDARGSLHALERSRDGGLSITPLRENGQRGKPINFEPVGETLEKRFLALVPAQLSSSVRRRALLRIQDGKALVSLRVPMPGSPDLSWLRLYYAVDLDQGKLVVASFEPEPRYPR